MERAYEQGSGNGNPAIAKMYLRALGKVERGHGYKRHYRGTNAIEHGRYPTHLHELVEDHGYEQDDDERRQHRAEGCVERAFLAFYLITYKRGDIGGKHARAALRDRQQVQELFFLYPTVFLHHFRLDNGNHGVSATKGERAYLEKGREQFATQTCLRLFGHDLLI